ERYRILFEESPYSIVILTSEGRIIDANPSIEGLIGYKKENLLNKHFSEIEAIPPNKLSFLSSLFEKILNKEDVQRVDIELFRKDGTRVWANLQGSIVEFDNKPYMLLMLHDISKRKEAELIISDELEKLKELNNTRRNLIIRVSHELKTPLLLISGGIEYLFSIAENKLDPKILDVLRSIERASNRLQGLIENLLDATKIDYNKFILNKSQSDFSRIIRGCVKELNYLIKKRHLELSVNIPDNLNIRLDELRLQQVITNLLLNAIKNTQPNGEISLILKKEKEWTELRIKDNGVGITDEEKEKLFTRFGKIERQGEDFEFIDLQGSGLGLYLSKVIINMHGGEIWVESEGRNKGSTFVIRLPLNL
ncbi:MAG: PAS domain-containing sensor histidine kinase, partial [Candidatus Lokiarchaeota archaeon]